MQADMVIGLVILLGLTAWSFAKIIGRTRRHENTSILQWVAFFIGLIGLDLWRVLEGFSPSIADSSDLVRFLASSFLVVICPPVAIVVYRHFALRSSSDHPPTQGEAPSTVVPGTPRIRIAKACVVLVIVLALTVFYGATVLIGAAYTYGITGLPENRNPSGLTLPELAVQAMWVAEYGWGRPDMEPWSTTALIRLCVVSSYRYGPPEAPRGRLVARRAAGILSLRKGPKNQDPTLRMLRQQVMASWVSRNWTADQAARTVLAEAYYGNGCYGMDQASRGYFGCLPNELSMEEVALLVWLQLSPTGNNPWRYPERAKEMAQWLLARLATMQGTSEPPRNAERLSRLGAGPRGEDNKKASGINAAPGDDGVMDFMKPCYTGDLLDVKKLLQRGVDVNSKDHYGRTALMAVGSHFHQELTELLLASGADVNATDDFGWTALMDAAYWGRFKVTKLLLKNGADVNVKDKWGETARMLASANGHTKIEELLAAHGAR